MVDKQKIKNAISMPEVIGAADLMAAQSNTISEKSASGVFSPRIWRRIREIGLGYGLLTPAFLLLLVFELYPVIYGFYISMCDWKLTCVKVIFFDNMGFS